MARQAFNRQVLRRQPLRRQVLRGERVVGVSSREKSVFVAKQLNINPDEYDFEFYDNGRVKSVQAKPEQYTKEKKKQKGYDTKRYYDTYIPHSFILSPDGMVIKEIKRGTYYKYYRDAGSGDKPNRKAGSFTKNVYVSEVTDFVRGTREIYGRREMTHGRETIRLESRTRGGVTKQFKITDQTSKAYKKRSVAERELLRTYGYRLERSAKYVREQQIVSERERIQNLFFEAQAQKKLTGLIKSGKVVPDRFGVVAISVGGKRFKFKVGEGYKIAEKSALRAQDLAEKLVSQGKISPGVKTFSIKVDGVDYTFDIGVGKKVTGEVHIDVPPKDILEKITRELTKAKGDQLALMGKAGPGEKLFRGVVVLGVIGAFRGLKNAAVFFRHPRETAKGLFEALRPKNIRATLKGEVENFAVDPVGVIAEYYTFGRVLGMASRAVKGSSVGHYVQDELFIGQISKKISSETGIPRGRVEPVIRSIVKGSEVQKKINPFNLKSIRKVDFFGVESLSRVEAMAVKKALQATDSVLFGSAAQYILSKGKTSVPKDVDVATKSMSEFNKVFIESIPKSQRKNYVERGQKIYRDVSSKAKASDVRGAIRIGSKWYDPIMDVKPLERLIQQKNLLTGKGMLPVSGYVTKLKGVEQFKFLRRLSKKIDLLESKLIKKPVSVKARARNLKILKRISKLQSKLRKEKSKFKLSDIPKPILKAVSDAMEVTTEKLVKIEGIKMVGFSEQTLRKALGTLQVLIEKEVRRAKDPQAFVNNLQVQLESLKRVKSKNPLIKLRNRRRIKVLSDALKVLVSKDFVRILEKRVPGLTRNYPILSKISVSKLEKTRKLPAKKLKEFILKDSLMKNVRVLQKKISGMKPKTKVEIRLKAEYKIKLERLKVKLKGGIEPLSREVGVGVRKVRRVVRVGGERLSAGNALVVGKVRNGLRDAGIKVRFAKYNTKLKIKTASSSVMRSIDVKLLKLRRMVRKSSGLITTPIKRLFDSLVLALRDLNIRLRFTSFRVGERIGVLKREISKPIRKAKRVVRISKTAALDKIRRIMQKKDPKLTSFGVQLKIKSYEFRKKIDATILREINLNILRLRRRLRISKGKITFPISRILKRISVYIPIEIVILRPKKVLREFVKKKGVVVSKIVRKKLVGEKPLRVSEKVERRPSELRRVKRPSRLPPSKLPSRIPSKVPSKLPSKVPSKLPSKVPSRIPSRVPSKVPSKLPSKVPSKLPSKVPSRIPSRVPSKIPSRIPSRVLSKLVFKDKLGVTERFRRQEIEKAIEKEFSKAKRDRKFIYLSDLQSIIEGRKAVKSERSKLLMKGRIFSGLEKRPIV